MDEVVISVYRNSILHRSSSIPAYADKQGEDKKFSADRISSSPIATTHGGQHVLVLFVIKDGGRRGAYANAMLRALLAITTLAKGMTSPLTNTLGVLSPAMLLSLQLGSNVATKAFHVIASRLFEAHP
jgi:hypothetical protein